MGHISFAIIKHNEKQQERYLVKAIPKDNTHEFFTSYNNALNGRYYFDDFKKAFCKEFNNISPSNFSANYYPQELGIDLRLPNSKDSSSIVELEVDSEFYYNTKNIDKYRWVSLSEIENLKLVHPEVFKKYKEYNQKIYLPADFKESIKVLTKAKSKNKLVVFAGAGISKDSGIPLWGETKKQIIEVLGQGNYDNIDPVVIAQYLLNARGHKEYNEKIREILGYYNNLEPNPIHDTIINLQPQHIITTNFDNLLEKSMSRNPSGTPYSLVKEDKDFPYSDTSRFIVKMHGDWDNMNFVFTEDDYINYPKVWPITEGFVKGVFASHVILFIGFSFDDRNLKQIIEWVKYILKNDTQPVYLFTTDNKNEHEREYFAQKGVKLITYPDILDPIYEKFDIKHQPQLSPIGQKTYNFLRILENGEYNIDFVEKNTKKVSIIDKLYNSLQRFRSFNALPKYLFEELYPFSPYRDDIKSMQQIDAVSHYNTIETRNEEIIKLMRSIIKKENKFTLHQGDDLRKNTYDIENKLWYIFDKITASNIDCIHRDNEDEDQFLHHKIEIYNPFPDDLLYVNWANLRYSDLIKKIEHKEYKFGQAGEIPNPLHYALLEGYILYKMHYFLESYNVFLKVEDYARKSGELSLYFLALRNRVITSKYLYNSRYSGKYSYDYCQAVHNINKGIDLEYNLSILSLDQEVKKLLSDINSGVLFQKYEHDISKDYDEIIKIYKNPPYSYFGKNRIESLEYKYSELRWFYESNGIIDDNDHLFTKTSEKFFEACIASCIICEKHKQRSEGFEAQPLLYCLKRISSKFIMTVFHEYKVDSITILPSNRKFFLDTCINAFNNFFNTNAWENNVPNTKFINYIADTSIYKPSLKEFYSNLLIILSKIDINEEYANHFIKILLIAYNNGLSKLLGTDGKKYIDTFIISKIHLFSSDKIGSILNLTLKDNAQGLSSKIFTKIKLYHKDFLIDNIRLVELYRPNSLSEITYYYIDLLELYQVMDKSIQNTLWKEINRHVESDISIPSIILFLKVNYLRQKNLIDFTDNVKKKFELLHIFKNISHIKYNNDGELIERLSHDAAVEPAVHIEYNNDDHPHLYASLVKLVTQAKYNNRLSNNTIKWLLSQPELPNSLKCLLNPYEFNYDYFDPYWLFFVKNDPNTLTELSKNIALSNSIKNKLKIQYSEALAEIYIKYFIS